MANYHDIKYNVDYAGKAGSLIPISTFTSDGSDATASFTSGIDSTYDEYWFIFNDIHGQTDDKDLTFQGGDLNLIHGSKQFLSKSIFQIKQEKDNTIKDEKIIFLKIVSTVIKTGMNIIGVETPEKM